MDKGLERTAGSGAKKYDVKQNSCTLKMFEKECLSVIIWRHCQVIIYKAGNKFVEKVAFNRNIY